MPDGWSITAQAQTQQLGPSGNLVDYVQVSAVSEPEEYETTVRVPKKAGWQDAARAAIEADFAAMRELAS
jgi:hypothetical protein